MKKFITLMLILTVAIINTQATEINPVSGRIKKSFSKEFTDVGDVSWSWVAERDLYRAAFIFNGKEVNAYFTLEGDFVGTSRYISRQHMPVIVTQELNKKYPDYVVRTIIEYASKDQTNYYITIESRDKAYMVKASPAGELTKFKKIKKS